MDYRLTTHNRKKINQFYETNNLPMNKLMDLRPENLNQFYDIGHGSLRRLYQPGVALNLVKEVENRKL